MQQNDGLLSLAEAQRQARDALALSDTDIARLLAPKRGVAFVGSTTIGAAQRHQIARYGDVQACIVNPKGGDGEIPIYKSIRDLPDGYDLAVIRVAAPHIAGIIEDCAARGIKDVLIYSDGFAETGPKGAVLEAALARTIARTGVRVVGPNTNDNTFEHYARPSAHRGGGIALITQSGANGRSLVEGVAMGACFHRWVTVGNEVDLETADFIHHFAGLDDVSTIARIMAALREQ